MPISVSVGDLMEFKVVGEFNAAQETNNVFHYKESGTVLATLDQYAIGLMNAIETNVYPIISSAQRFIRIDASILDVDGHLVNGESVFFPVANQAGAVAGDALPPYAAWTFKYVRPSATFRHGFKRFAGVPESMQSGGFPASSALSLLATAATSLEQVIAGMTQDSDGNPDTVVTGSLAAPVVLQRVINGDPISPVNVASISDVVFDKIGTQNSRKYGVGS